MLFISNRNSKIKMSLSEAIQSGLAKDGGLFIPESFPKIKLSDFQENLHFCDFAQLILNKFFKDDLLFPHLKSICENAFQFQLPVKRINKNTLMLDLCHGPTLSFKDFGARFLAECINHISIFHKTTIMVATSGDTGSAVASAFYNKENTQVVVLYPKGQISKKQEQQITCWGKNVLSLAVHGTFDDCQKIVKDAFQEISWNSSIHLSSANSINIGRLLPQMLYYAFTSMQYYFQHNNPIGYIVPTGNLGNATAAYWAKEMGFPIREIVLATNENKTIGEYINTGEFLPRKSISTLANAMDVGNPSNFDRLSSLYMNHSEFIKNVKAISVSDSEIKETIIEIYKKYGVIICPHTATAFFARKNVSDLPWIVVATAHACKFNDIIEPLIEQKITVPIQMLELLNKETQSFEIQANLSLVKQIVEKYFL